MLVKYLTSVTNMPNDVEKSGRESSVRVPRNAEKKVWNCSFLIHWMLMLRSEGLQRLCRAEKYSPQ